MFSLDHFKRIKSRSYSRVRQVKHIMTFTDTASGSFKKDHALKLPQGATRETCLEVTPGSVEDGCNAGNVL